MNRIEREWNDFAAKVLPKSASAVQHSEMRKAFYAGAMSAFAVISGVGEGSGSEAEGLALLGDLQREFRECGDGLWVDAARSNRSTGGGQ